MANNKKYISLNRLSNFLDNLKNTFATISHKHTVSDLTDYKVDSELSSTSTNPVQNKVLDAEFEAIANSMNALDLAIDGKADETHTHSISDVTNLQTTLDGKVPTSRTVNGKALNANISLSASDVGASPSSHSHDDRYYTESEIDEKLANKANATHTHSNYVPTTRTVNGKALSANITLSASDVGALPDTTVIPSIDGLATEEYVSDVAGTKVDKVSGKGLSTNDYTTTEKNKLSGIATGAEVNQNAFSNVVVGSTTIAADSKTDSLTIAAGTGISVAGDATNDKVTITNSGVRSIATGSSNGTISVNTNGETVNVAVKGLGSAAYTASTAYDAAGSASDALASAKEYTNTKVSNLASTTVVDNKISSHNTSTSAHNDIRALITALTTKVNNFLDVDDTTTDQLSEVITLINNNKGTLESLTTSKVNVSDIVNNLTTNSTSKVLSAAQGVAIKSLIDALQTELDSHTHAIADVTGLQSALDGKAASSHGTHVSYSTTAPVMDGTASVGTAATVARSDHKHPTDTSRASKSEFDAHTANTTAHITSTERSNWNAAKTHADSAHAPSNAEKNQNAFSNITVGSTTVAADTATDTVTFVGSNVTITPDATNDKITFAVADGSTSAKGIVKLTNSTSSTSTTTAATPSSVKSAYDLANTAKTNAATAQSKADSAYTLAEGKVDSLSDLGITATATELNYVDGVTSNVQTQLDGKAASSHNHAASNITSGTLSSDRLPTVPISKGGTGSTTATGALTNLGITATAAELNTLDGITATTAELNKLDGVTATTAELNYVDGVTSNIQTQLNGKLGKTTYEYNKELALGSTGKVCIGKFPMYDSNISVEIKSTTSTTYNGTLVIATQNINTTGGGTYTATVYGDASNTLTDSIKIKYASGSNVFEVYIDLPGWSKNLLHIQCVALKGEPTDIATTVTEIPSTATIVPTNALKSQLDAKQATVTGGASTITSSNLTANRALISNDSGKVAVSAVTSTELGYLDGVTSNIQTQLDGKSNTSHTHKYAGSSSAGGSATSAVKLDTSTAGSATQPVYFSDGKPVATTYTLGKSVPSDAKFTDTVYTLPAAGTALGGVKSGGDVTIASGVITVNDDSHNHTIANVDNLQSSLDGKQATITGAATTITGSNLTASRALVSNSSGKVAVSAVTSTELGYLDGVTSSIQTQLDGKAAKSEGAFYIEGTGTTDSTNKISAWTGTSDRITSYYDGLTIRYKIGVVGQSTVTLNINNLGAKTVYRFNTTKLTTHFPVGSIIHLIYHEDLNDGCWVTNDYDANTNTYQRVYESSNNVEYPITTRYNTTDGSSYYAEYGRYTNGVTLNPSTNTITATTFKGALAGNADSATTLSGLTATVAELNKLDGVTATTTELNYVDGVTSNIQTQLNGKASTSAATQSAAGLMSAADKTKLDGVPSNIQTQLDSKPNTSDIGFVRIVSCTSSDGVTYTGTTDGVTALTAGLTIVFTSSKTSASTTPTLNINGLGAKSIKRRLSHLSTTTQAGYSNTWLYANKPYLLVYDGTQWIVDGLTKPSAADLYGTLPIEKGGTGATTAAAALTNLGAAPAYTYGTTDLTAGTSELANGTLYFMYE